MPGLDTTVLFQRITADLIAYVAFGIGAIGLLVIAIDAIRTNDKRIIREQRDTITLLYRQLTAAHGDRDE